MPSQDNFFPNAEEVVSIQEAINDMLKGKSTISDIMRFLKKSIEDNPSILNSILMNYIVHSDIVQKITSEEFKKISQMIKDGK